MTARRRWTASLAVVAALALAGCGDEHEDGSPDADWPAETSTALDGSGLVYAIGDTVHLGDGSTLSVAREVDRFVVARAGVFFTVPRHHGLYYSAGDGSSRRVAADASDLMSSPDGRYLMFMDMASGEKDGFGTPQGQVVVVDTAAGDEVAGVTEAMGDPGSDDLADLYEDAEPRLLGFAEDTAYYQGARDVVAIDLSTGRTDAVDAAPDLPPVPPADDRLSSDGRWRIVDDNHHFPGHHDRLASSDGRAIPLTGVPIDVDLGWWVDATTAAGIAVDGGYDHGFYADGTSAALVTCVVPSGRCTPVEGTSGATVHVPERTFEHTSFELPGG